MHLLVAVTILRNPVLTQNNVLLTVTETSIYNCLRLQLVSKQQTAAGLTARVNVTFLLGFSRNWQKIQIVEKKNEHLIIELY